MKIINVYWFTESAGFRPIGIVTGTGAVGEKKAYLGTGAAFNEKEDKEQIAKYGAPLTVTILKEILRDLEGK